MLRRKCLCKPYVFDGYEILVILRKEILMFLQIITLYTSLFYLKQIVLHAVT